MPIPLTGITGRAGGATAANRADRVTNLKNKIGDLDPDKAKGVLSDLRGDIANKSGYLRLDGGGRDGEVSFSTRWNLNPFRSAKGEVTGGALRSLFKKAGYDTHELEGYLRDRGNNRLDLQRLRGIIDNAVIRFQSEPTAAILNSSPESTIHVGQQIGAGGLGIASAATFQGRDVVYKTLNQPVPVAMDPTPVLSDSMLRGGEVTATYLGNKVRGISTPTHYVVRETRPDGTSQDHVVKGSHLFRRWVSEKLQPIAPSNASAIPRIEVTGLIMERAPGVELDDAVGLNEASLNGIANKGLATLSDLAKGGFVHGDIKGRNLIYNDQTGDLTFIDTGGMAKASKDAARTEDTMFDINKNPLTPAYTHPGFLDNDGKLGFEQDLFSFGVTLLVASLESSNDQVALTNAKAVLDGIKTYNDTVSKATPQQRQELYAHYQVADSNGFVRWQINQIQVQPGSVAEKGLQFINLALDQKQPVTDRAAWTAQLQGLIS